MYKSSIKNSISEENTQTKNLMTTNTKTFIDENGEDKEGMDEFFQKAYKENFGFWITAGGLHPGRTMFKYINLAYMVVAPLTAFPIFVTVLVNTDPSIYSECVHFVIFLIVMTIIVVSFSLSRRNVENVYRSIGKRFYDYGDSLDEETRQGMEDLYEFYSKRRNLMVKFFTFVVVFAYSWLTFFRPIFKYIQGDHLAGSPDDGMHVIIPVSVWLPFYKYGFWSNFSVIFLQLTGSTLTLGTVMGHCVFFLTSSDNIVCSLEALGLGMRRIRARAKAMSGSMEHEQALRYCMAHSIRHHQAIISVVGKLQDVVYYPSLSLLVGSTILICMSGFLLFNEKVSLSTKACFSLCIGSELSSVLIYCYYGEQIKTYSGNLHEEIYNSEWLEDSKVLRNYILVIQARTTEGLGVSAGGYMYLNLETYGQVLSSAFSYFNIMNAVN